MAPNDDDPVPRLPRGRMFRLTLQQVFRIVMTAAILVMIIVVQRPCAQSVSKVVMTLDPGSGSGSGSGSAVVDPTVYEPISADMTPEQIQAAMARARARAAAQQGSGVGSATTP